MKIFKIFGFGIKIYSCKLIYKLSVVEILDFFLALKAATDKLEGFPWIKASKAKARFGTTTPASVEEPVDSLQDQPELSILPQSPPFQLTNEQLQDYLASISASLQPYVIQTPASAPAPPPYPVKQYGPPAKKPSKGKVPKQVKPSDGPTTTDSYWDAERKMYPDSFYDEFYLDWLRKRQVEETGPPSPSEELSDSTNSGLSQVNAGVPQQPQAMSPQSQQPFPTVPLSFNPYMVNPYLYPLAGMKVSKAMMQAQVGAALSAMNITTTAKPVKIKLKIPIPAGSDLAQIVSSGIAGFPSGTTYELSKKK